MSVALAAAPVLVVLGALLLRRPAWQAAAAGLAVLAVTTWLADPPVDLGAAAGDSAVLVLEVGLVLLGGLALAEVGRRRGFPEAVTSYVAATGAPRPAVVLLVVLGLTPFAESVTGFGVGAVIAAPILLALGLRPLAAAVVALLGLCTVPWGALAPGTLVAAALTGLDPDALGVASAAASLPVFLTVGGAAVLISDGRRAALRHAPDLLAVAVALAAGILLANLAVGTPPAGAVGALVGTAVATAVLRMRSGRPLPPAGPVARTAAPYLVLLLGLIGGRAAAALLDGPPGRGSARQPRDLAAAGQRAVHAGRAVAGRAQVLGPGRPRDQRLPGPRRVADRHRAGRRTGSGSRHAWTSPTRPSRPGSAASAAT